MSVLRHTGRLARNAALWAAFATAFLLLILAAFGFLAVAVFVWLETHLGTAGAAALTALLLFGLAGMALLTGYVTLRRLRVPEGGFLGNGALSLLTSLAGALIRQDPKRAVLLSLLAGALAEYLTTRD